MRAILVALVFLVGGCGLVPSTSKRSSATAGAASSSVKSSETFSKIVNGTKQESPPSELRVGGIGNKVDVTVQPQPVHQGLPPSPQISPALPTPIPAVAANPLQRPQPYREEIRYTSDVDAGDKEQNTAQAKKDVSIPLGVNLGLLGIGILILLFALKRVRDSSLSVSAAYTAFDGILASQIRSLRERAMTSTDQSTITMLQAQLVELEAQRGRLAR